MSDRTAEDAETAEERVDDESATDGAAESAEGEDHASSPGGAEPSQGDRAGEATPEGNPATESPPRESGAAQGEGGATRGENGAGGAEAAADSEDAESAPAAEALADRVAEYDERLADQVRAELGGDELDEREVRRELTAREERIEELEERVADLEEKLKRKQADFQNFKKRQQKKLADQQARATESLLERFLPVRDNLVRALEQDESADIREGVRGTLNEFDRVLDAEDVSPIEPDPGESTDPNRHEVMMRVESDEPEGTVVDVYRPGYEMEERVVRTAQVTVSDGQGGE